MHSSLNIHSFHIKYSCIYHWIFKHLSLNIHTFEFNVLMHCWMFTCLASYPHSQSISLYKILHIPAIIVVCLAVIVAALIWSILDPTLSVQLNHEVGSGFCELYAYSTMLRDSNVLNVTRQYMIVMLALHDCNILALYDSYMIMLHDCYIVYTFATWL